MTVYENLKASNREEFEKLLVSIVLAFGDAQHAAIFGGLEGLCKETKDSLIKKFGQAGEKLSKFIDDAVIQVIKDYQESASKVMLSEERAIENIRNLLDIELKEGANAKSN